MVLVLGLGGLAWWFLYAPPPPEPVLDAEVVRGELTIDGMTRTYIAVVPRALPDDAPAVLIFHGARMTADAMRTHTGYRFDELAVERGFVAIYPQGYRNTWHDCRAATPYPARLEDIDDLAFVDALVRECTTRFRTGAVFAAGLSNGGHFSIRLAAERTDVVSGIAAFGAAYPAPESNVCTPVGDPIPTMFVLGDADRINPFRGGMAGAFGTKLGRVLSAHESAATVARRHGITGEPATDAFANTGAPGASDVTRVTYGSGTPAPVVLLAVHRGGHIVPNPVPLRRASWAARRRTSMDRSPRSTSS